MTTVRVSRTADATLPAELPRIVRTGGPVARQIFDRLHAAILSVQLPPGSPLSENEIASQLGVSRTPVREALGRLAADGLVTIYPQVGSFVARIDLEDVVEAQFIRESLEAAVVREVANRRTPTAVAELRSLIDAQRQAADVLDVAQFYDADEAFHAAVFVLAGHPRAWRALRSVKFQMDRVRRMSFAERQLLDQLIAEHGQMVDAIDAGDPDAAEAVLRSHARRVLVYAPIAASQVPQYFASTDERGSE